MKKILFFFLILLFITQIFVSLDTQNIFQSNFVNETFNNKSNILLNVPQNANIGVTNILANNYANDEIAPKVEALKVTKTKVSFDMQKSNVGKIVFLSICAVIIIAVIVVLTIKIHKSGKK